MKQKILRKKKEDNKLFLFGRPFFIVAMVIAMILIFILHTPS
jgi:hypothetical protein